MQQPPITLEQAMDLADHVSPSPVSASMALKAMRTEIEVLRTALQEKDEPGLCRLVAEIRWACDDCGARMQPELVQYIAELFQQARIAKAPENQQSPSYEALLLIATSVSAALERAGVTDCDDPGEAIDAMRRRHEDWIAIAMKSSIAFRKQREAAMCAHTICYETMLAHPDIPSLGDDGKLHDAIHDILRVENSALLEGIVPGEMSPEEDRQSLGDCSLCGGTGEIEDLDGNGQLCAACEASGWSERAPNEDSHG